MTPLAAAILILWATLALAELFAAASASASAPSPPRPRETTTMTLGSLPVEYVGGPEDGRRLDADTAYHCHEFDWTTGKPYIPWYATAGRMAGRYVPTGAMTTDGRRMVCAYQLEGVVK